MKFLVPKPDHFANGPFIYIGNWYNAGMYDIFMNDNHTMIVDYKVIDNDQVTGYWIFESTTGSIDKVIHRFQSGSTLSAYDAYQYFDWN